ncbi:MAG: oxygen-independent coproporphyrinogen III oxidase-like protein, partial [Rhodoferax sp.]|nr:oxygen-independent coproporphyrinogen III oxidase-like protein [Rhodoferax sp.]
ALRLAGGFELPLFVERTGMPLSALQAGLAQAQAQGLIEMTGDHLQPSVRGFDFLNDLQALFLPAAP